MFLRSMLLLYFDIFDVLIIIFISLSFMVGNTYVSYAFTCPILDLILYYLFTALHC